MAEKDLTKKFHKLARDTDTLVQQVQQLVTIVVGDALDIKESVNEIREKLRKPKADE